jgi:hypothetical protein
MLRTWRAVAGAEGKAALPDGKRDGCGKIGVI